MSDPRAHRHARIVDGDRITYSCGCVNEIHPSGVLHSLEKCAAHRKERHAPDALGRRYYEGLGAIVDGIPRCADYLAELAEALGRFRRAQPYPHNVALEIGCGCSMYAPGLLTAGYDYRGLEPCQWAARWTAGAFAVPVTIGTLETLVQVGPRYDLILAAHCLEHMDDAPGAIRKCADLLEPGGEFWVVVPNDDDPLNPDHLWAFSSTTLAACLAGAGLDVMEIEERQRIERERFIYVRARKP